MVTFKKAAVALAAVSMLAAPVLASAAPAADLRALSAVEDENSLAPALIALLLAVVVGGIVVVADDSPSSP